MTPNPLQIKDYQPQTTEARPRRKRKARSGTDYVTLDDWAAITGQNRTTVYNHRLEYGFVKVGIWRSHRRNLTAIMSGKSLFPKVSGKGLLQNGDARNVKA